MGVPGQDEVVHAYGSNAHFGDRFLVAWNAFVNSFYRFGINKWFRAYDAPRIRCVGVEKLMFVGFWGVLVLPLLLVTTLHPVVFLSIFVCAGLLLLLCYFIHGRTSVVLIRTRKNLCRSCGYDLVGLASVGSVDSEGKQYDIGCACCPECGAEYPRIRP